jgi:hypothetical protein
MTGTKTIQRATHRTEMASEGAATMLFSQLGCAVMLQRGGLPEYDLMTDDGVHRPLPVSVKACHTAANWPLAALMKKAGVSYHAPSTLGSRATAPSP